MSRRPRPRQRRAAIEAKRYPTSHHQHTDDNDDRLDLDRLLGTLPGDDQQDDAFAQRDHEHARQMSRGSTY